MKNLEGKLALVTGAGSGIGRATALVLAAISGPDAGDLSSLPSRFAFDATRGVKGLKLGVVPAWMSGPAASDVEPAAARALITGRMRRCSSLCGVG